MAESIDAELRADLAHLIKAEAQDELLGREPLYIDYGSRCSYTPPASCWRRLRAFVGARKKAVARRDVAARARERGAL